MLTKIFSTFAVVGLSVIAAASVPETSASNDVVSVPNCCIKQAYCCKLQRDCCPNRGVSETSAATLDASDSVAATGRLSCCVKRAYCCSIKADCCGSSAAPTAQDVADVADDQLVKSSCCLKRAYCCSVKRSCCRGESTAQLVA